MHECIVLTREHNETPQNSAVQVKQDNKERLFSKALMVYEIPPFPLFILFSGNRLKII
jgi:hypothetical protein